MSTNRCDYCGLWESPLTKLCRCCNHCEECKLIHDKHTGEDSKSVSGEEIAEQLRKFSEW